MLMEVHKEVDMRRLEKFAQHNLILEMKTNDAGLISCCDDYAVIFEKDERKWRAKLDYMRPHDEYWLDGVRFTRGDHPVFFTSLIDRFWAAVKNGHDPLDYRVADSIAIECHRRMTFPHYYLTNNATARGLQNFSACYRRLYQEINTIQTTCESYAS